MKFLFGKVEDSAVYYGELYSFLARLRAIEKIPAPENLKLKLKIEVKEKAEKMWGEKWGTGSGAQGLDLQTRAGSGLQSSDRSGFAVGDEVARTGSNDPAKIFVQAAKGMSREEIDQITKEYVEEREKRFEKKGSHDEQKEFYGGEKKFPEAEFPATGYPDVSETVPIQYVSDEEAEKDFQKSLKAEKFLDFWDKWKYVMSLVPSGLFVLGVIAVLGVVLFGGVKDDGVTGLVFRVDYGIGFEETVRDDISATVDYEKKALIENDLVAKIAEGKNVDYVSIWAEEGGIGMNFKLKKGALEYLFSEVKGGSYRVKKFKRL